MNPYSPRRRDEDDAYRSHVDGELMAMTPEQWAAALAADHARIEQRHREQRDVLLRQFKGAALWTRNR